MPTYHHHRVRTGPKQLAIQGSQLENLSHIEMGCVAGQLQWIKATGTVKKKDHTPPDLWLKPGRPAQSNTATNFTYSNP